MIGTNGLYMLGWIALITFVIYAIRKL